MINWTEIQDVNGEVIEYYGIPLKNSNVRYRVIQVAENTVHVYKDGGSDYYNFVHIEAGQRWCLKDNDKDKEIINFVQNELFEAINNARNAIGGRVDEVLQAALQGKVSL
jgi:hypothetical protein